MLDVKLTFFASKILLVGAAVQTVALYTMAGLGVPRPVPNANKSGMVGMLLLCKNNPPLTPMMSTRTVTDP